METEAIEKRVGILFLLQKNIGGHDVKQPKMPEMPGPKWEIWSWESAQNTLEMVQRLALGKHMCV